MAPPRFDPHFVEPRRAMCSDETADLFIHSGLTWWPGARPLVDARRAPTALGRRAQLDLSTDPLGGPRIN